MLILPSFGSGDAHRLGPATGRPARGTSVALRARCIALALALSACGGDSVGGPGTDAPLTSPDPPAGFLRFSTITVGHVSTCGLTVEGDTYCWGTPYGPRHERPQHVQAAPAFVSLALGSSFSNTSEYDMLCGLTAPGVVLCRAEPGPGFTEVAAAVPFGNLTVGTAICGVGSGGDAFCWTYSLFGGVLGDGTLSNDGYVAGTPVAVAGGLSFRLLSAGRSYACGVGTDGKAYCWGAHNFGLQLGDGDPSEGPRPTPTPVAGGHRFDTIAAGESSTCALTTGGRAYCWGLAFFGQLGNPAASTADCPGIGNAETGSPMPCVGSPVPVAGDLRFIEIATGAQHTCGLAVDGRAYCWGANFWGQLGNGKSGAGTNEHTPVPVAGGLTFRALGAGAAFTCGIATNEATYCWGWNQFGELGAGLPLGHVATIPYPVAAP